MITAIAEHEGASQKYLGAMQVSLAVIYGDSMKMKLPVQFKAKSAPPGTDRQREEELIWPRTCTSWPAREFLPQLFFEYFCFSLISFFPPLYAIIIERVAIPRVGIMCYTEQTLHENNPHHL